MKKYLSDQRRSWTFNLQKAPWWGGFFERLIKSVKRCLYKIVRNARVTSEELYTVLTEIEATLNSRPLTFVSTEELEEAITPSHLLTGRRINSLPEPETGEKSKFEETSKGEIAKRVSYLRTLKEHFWLRWKEEYLLELRNSHRQRTKRQKENYIKLGDIVVVDDEKIRVRVQWKLGRVVQLIEGKDGAVRGAVVRKLTDKGERCTEIRRPIQKLYPVEISDGNEEDLIEEIYIRRVNKGRTNGQREKQRRGHKKNGES